MAKSKDTGESGKGESGQQTTPETTVPEEAVGQTPPQTGQPAGQQQTIHVVDEDTLPYYANFCRVSSTPEEVILDLGLNPNPYGSGETTVKVSQRIILNHFTAKRLLNALSLALQRHEQAFGVLETDVRKRVRQS